MDENKPVKLNCSFCGKEIECPENMLDAEKHACFECFQNLEGELTEDEAQRMHVDIPMEKMDEIMPEALMSILMIDIFPKNLERS